ncbi:GNAT family N-acetyltransferase [Nonomuraea sp. NPDC050783]|uniref:GNAT family N-acetyltransferase n=1 Tax=Nonomuraea sp. NPDC050783 TaxID=3154634 RepID=UPI003467BEBA
MSPLPTLSAEEIATGRLLLRKARDADRDGLVELFTDPEVRAHLGGPRPREEVERFLDAIGTAGATAVPGSYVIADRATDRFLGTLMLDRRPSARPGHLTEEGEELELSYVLRRGAWGQGFAFEAATAALRAAAAELPDQSVLIVTQSANERSLRLAARLGFRPVGTFEEFGAEQTLGAARLSAFAGGPR